MIETHESGGTALVNRIVRYVVVALSLGVVAAGILIIGGWLVPRHFPDQYRVPAGAVVLLYGLYRCVVVLTRRQRR